MIKKQSSRFITRGILLIAALLLAAPSSAQAIDVQFFQSNNIYYFAPGAAEACRPGSAAGGNTGAAVAGAIGNEDYKGRPILTEEQLENIQLFQPAYEEAAAETKIPWQMLAVIHIRESNQADYNPPHNDGSGSQGIYQDYGWTYNNGVPYEENGPVSPEEFLRQTINAGKHLRQKAEDVGQVDLLEKGDPGAVKEAFFGYNGRAPIYRDQARALGFDGDAEGYEGSPYVMNKADEARDPDIQGDNGKWVQYVADGVIGEKAGSDYGAWLMYTAIAGLPSGTGNSIACAGQALGQRVGELIAYYQVEEPWASKKYGPHDIRGWGCGPTSTAMAIATLKGDDSINPENMAQFFVENGWLVDSGTSWDAWTTDNALSKKYGVTTTELGTDMSKAAEALKRGSFVILSVTGAPLTCANDGNGKPCGHILLLRGVTDSGNFLFADPANRERTEDEVGADIQSAGSYGIRNMWEIR